MKSKAATVAFPESIRTGKALPEVNESRKDLIAAVKKTEAYGDKKNPLNEQLRTLVNVAENRGKLYGENLDATTNKLIAHMDLLRSIGETLNPRGGMNTPRAVQSLHSETPKNAAPTFSPEDRTVLIKFLTSEAILCTHEIDKVGKAIDAREKSFSNHASYKAGIAGVTHQVKTFHGDRPETYLKIEYHKVQEEQYARAADDYHKSARLFSEAQLHDSAIKTHKNPEQLQMELSVRSNSAATNEKNTRISELTENNTKNTRDDVKAEIDIIVEKLDTTEEREIDAQGKGLGKEAKNYRETNALSTQDVKAATATVEASNLKIEGLEKTQKDSRKNTASNLKEIGQLHVGITDSATKFVGEKDNAAIRYKSLMTQSSYYEDSATKTMERASTEVENHYEDKGYNLNTNKEPIKSEDTSIRASLLEFKKLKAVVTEFQDNLSSSVGSVAPMKSTRERSASVSITKKPPATSEAETQSPAIARVTRERSASVSPGSQSLQIAGLLRAKEAKMEGKPAPEKEKAQEGKPSRSGPRN